jgi:predicted Rossmann-fold nucleotide-binding protein
MEEVLTIIACLDNELMILHQMKERKPQMMRKGNAKLACKW